MRRAVRCTGEFERRCGLRKVCEESSGRIAAVSGRASDNARFPSGTGSGVTAKSGETASTSLYTETLAKKAQVPGTKSTGSSGFGMIPDDVLQRPEITPGAKVVLACLGRLGHGKSLVAFSHDYIGANCGLARRGVASALSQLETVRLIRKSGEKVKQVQPYEILHPRLVNEKSEATPEVGTARNHKPQAFTPCGGCGKLKRVGVGSFCRKCIRNAEVARIAREAGRRAAIEELGRASG